MAVSGSQGRSLGRRGCLVQQLPDPADAQRRRRVGVVERRMQRIRCEGTGVVLVDLGEGRDQCLAVAVLHREVR